MPLWDRTTDSPFGKRLRELRILALESLGAGYYSFGKTKHRFYAEARGRIGAALGLIYSEPALRRRYPEDLLFIESKVLPAFSALIRKMERHSVRERHYGE